MDSDPVQRHRDEAGRHQRAAEAHAASALFWRDGGSVAKAEREEQFARTEREAADFERRRAQQLQERRTRRSSSA